MGTNTEIIEEFVKVWSTLDAAKIASYFTEDGCYYNIPAKPVAGRDNIEQFVRGFLANWTETHWDIINIAGNGNTVFCERLDRIKSSNGDVDLPCVGVFIMEDGKICEWRDYFDMGTFVNSMN